MKRLLATLLLLVCGLASLGASGPVQTLNIDETMKVSEIGDCDIAINFTLTAAQYAMWNQKYGQNPSLLRRDFGKLVSQYDTHDWKVDAKAMERFLAHFERLSRHALATLPQLADSWVEYDTERHVTGLNHG